MAEIKVLIEGYAKKINNGWKASSTTCLITTGDKKIITDPGCNYIKLLSSLEKEKLTIDDIDYVFLSHCHPDHVMLAGVFTKAKYITFDDNLMYDKDIITSFDKNELGEDIEIISTPGHVYEHLSLIVKTKKGKIAVAGDVIWWLDDEEQVLDLNQEDHSHAVGMDMNLLIDSRKKLLKISDYIIPGHGKMFKVDKILL